jgi:hypothetical protein
MSPIALIANKGFIIKLFVINLFYGIQTFAQELSGSELVKKQLNTTTLITIGIRLKENLLLK